MTRNRLLLGVHTKHEVSHSLTGPDMSGPFEERIRREAAALGKKVPGGLWHMCLFYITGEVWRSELEARGIQYEPYLYRRGFSTGAGNFCDCRSKPT